MMQRPDRPAWLFKQYVSGKCTEAETEEFFRYAADPAYKDTLDTLVYLYLEELSISGNMPPIDWDYMYNRIVSPPRVKPIRNQLWRRLAVASSLLLVLSAAAWLLWRSSVSLPQMGTTQAQHKVAPGGQHALLTLSDGTVIPLDSAANGTLARQGNVNILKLDSGRLAYSAAASKTVDAPTFNILTTPRGGQFRVILPDGSRVWLNAASSIRFPTTFIGKERRVELSGEAYFEVEEDNNMPFIVGLNGEGQVLVLGTHFNINAYNDEGLQKTTLLEGAVLVTAGGHRQMLRPGEQAQVQPANASAGITVRQTDVEEVLAWKNGYFQFNQADLRAVMRQLARWYDVEISYEGSVPESKFWGDISREANITDVLKVLEKSGVHFRLEGKKIIVTQ
ncbi:FecR family protein [Chitinophaga sp. 22321]|uniref:FecR domain-containing protein n=2 Tax=Chitinophaga hostae TaxID=2831022 RepID=A0ABS5IZ05_9BACT|nr:FecR family protein [Chitinophaga hostae]MBS0028196.1 FecR domain-containing protein [Chitinophaga hostae]